MVLLADELYLFILPIALSTVLTRHIDGFLFESHQGITLTAAPVAPHMLTGPLFTEQVSNLITYVEGSLEGRADVFILLFAFQDGQKRRLSWAKLWLGYVRSVYRFVTASR